MIAAVLQLLGLSMEIVGVLLMANLYTGIVPWRQLLSILLSALVRGATAVGAVEVADLRAENKMAALQGLALVGGGFFLQALGVLWSWLGGAIA
ncbi:MAG: hypothetical protein H6970_14035 [Gammaproteobacteria bacterium]|nr:hypothetical protein [Gammaproteobacteria bacterium]